MALATYSDLKTAITTWTARSDLAGLADDFIDLTEAEINRSLRGRQQIKITTLTPDVNGKVTLPADYISFRNVVSLGGLRYTLEPVSPKSMDTESPQRVGGIPTKFSVDGTTLQIMPTSTDNIELEYFSTVPALSDSNTTNWVLTKAPNIYLHGCLKHAFTYTRNIEAAQAYSALFQKDLDDLQQEEYSAVWPSGSARIMGGSTP